MKRWTSKFILWLHCPWPHHLIFHFSEFIPKARKKSQCTISQTTTKACKVEIFLPCCFIHPSFNSNLFHCYYIFRHYGYMQAFLYSAQWSYRSVITADITKSLKTRASPWNVKQNPEHKFQIPSQVKVVGWAMSMATFSVPQACPLSCQNDTKKSF